jgi:hypothetical protein
MSESRVSTTTMELVHNQVALIIADLELHSYYQLLEVAPEDGPSVVEFNYDTLRHEYDKLRNHHRCTKELREGLDLLLDRLEEAKQVLCNSGLREEYDERLALGETRHARAVKARADDRAASRPPGQSLEDRSRLSFDGFDLKVPEPVERGDPAPKESGQLDLSELAGPSLPDQFDDETARRPAVPPHHDPPPPEPEPALQQGSIADEEFTGNTTNRFAFGAKPERPHQPMAILRQSAPGEDDEETTRRDQRSVLPLPPQPDEEYVADDATDQDLQVRGQATEQTERMVVVSARSNDEPE